MRNNMISHCSIIARGVPLGTSSTHIIILQQCIRRLTTSDGVYTFFETERLEYRDQPETLKGISFNIRCSCLKICATRTPSQVIAAAQEHLQCVISC